MKYILILKIEDNKGYLKYDKVEDIAEFFTMHHAWFKQPMTKKITIEFMSYCEYKKKKHAGEL